jgi:protein phosphatase 1 regulatory subunit 10
MKKVVPAAAALAVKTEAKTDSSFFSAPKQKAKLPSFNKVKSETKDAATAGVFDPFKEALAGLTKGRKGSGSPANATTPPPPGSRPMSIDLLPVVDPATLTRGVSTKTGRPKKVVSWAGADALEQVKFITKAIYDDDELVRHIPAIDISRAVG